MSGTQSVNNIAIIPTLSPHIIYKNSSSYDVIIIHSMFRYNNIISIYTCLISFMLLILFARISSIIKFLIQDKKNCYILK